MNRRTILAAALVWTATWPTISQAEEPVETPEAKKVPWNVFLAELPEQLDYHVTIERLLRTQGEKRQPSAFDRDDLTLDPNIKTVESLVKKLRSEMKGVAVVQNTKNPAVIHLIDERLFNAEGYVMDKKVDITYSGLIDGLADEVGKHAPGIGSPTGALIGEVPGDFRTKVKVDAKDQTVREVVTGCVPLKDYSRMLWEAKTWKNKDGQYQTIVRYQGLRRLPPGDQQ